MLSVVKGLTASDSREGSKERRSTAIARRHWRRLEIVVQVRGVEEGNTMGDCEGLRSKDAWSRFDDKVQSKGCAWEQGFCGFTERGLVCPLENLPVARVVRCVCRRNGQSAQEDALGRLCQPEITFASLHNGG